MPIKISTQGFDVFVGSTFGELLSSEVKGEFCRIKVLLDVQDQLQRGIFIVLDNGEKVWVLFKYENL